MTCNIISVPVPRYKYLISSVCHKKLSKYYLQLSLHSCTYMFLEYVNLFLQNFFSLQVIENNLKILVLEFGHHFGPCPQNVMSTTTRWF